MNLLTPYEYRILMKGARYRSVDQQLLIYETAYLTREAKAQRKFGKKTKLVYRSFKDFYDYEEELRKVKGNITKVEVSPRFQGLAKYLAEKQKQKAQKG